MLRTIAYIIFLCTGLFALTLIVLFFRSQNGIVSRSVNNNRPDTVISTSVNEKVLEKVNKGYKFRKSEQDDIF